MKLGILGAAAGGALIERLVGPLGAEVHAVDVRCAADDQLDALVLTDAIDAAQWPAVVSYAARGGAVLGVGEGCRALCEAELLDGAVVGPAAPALAERCCVVEGRPTPFSHAIPAGRELRLPRARVAGAFAHADPAQLDEQARVVLRYCGADGEVDVNAGADGRLDDVAGICNAAGNVVGLLVSPSLASPDADGDWRAFFASLAGWRGGGIGRV